MNPLGVDYLTLYGAHPLDYIRTAARAGCTSVAFFTRALDFPGMPPAPPSLFDDPRLRREVMACLKDHGLSIGLIDGFSPRPGATARDYRPVFDVLGELEVTRINTASNEPWERTVDETAALVEMAAEYSLTVTVEAVGTFTLGTLPKALDLVRAVNQPHFKLLIDTMHVSSTGGVPLLRTLDPSLIGYVQICDGPLPMPSPEIYFNLALFERAVPGEGDFPLVEILECLPDDVIVSQETPMRKRKAAGVSDFDRLHEAVAGTRKVLQAAGKAVPE